MLITKRRSESAPIPRNFVALRAIRLHSAGEWLNRCIASGYAIYAEVMWQQQCAMLRSTRRTHGT